MEATEPAPFCARDRAHNPSDSCRASARKGAQRGARGRSGPQRRDSRLAVRGSRFAVNATRRRDRNASNQHWTWEEGKRWTNEQNEAAQSSGGGGEGVRRVEKRGVLGSGVGRAGGFGRLACPVVFCLPVSCFFPCFSPLSSSFRLLTCLLASHLTFARLHLHLCVSALFSSSASVPSPLLPPVSLAAQDPSRPGQTQTQRVGAALARARASR